MASELDFARPVRSPLRQRPAAIPRRISDLARGCYDVFPAAAGIRILRVDRQPPRKARSRTLAQVNQRLTAPSAERHVQSRAKRAVLPFEARSITAGPSPRTQSDRREIAEARILDAALHIVAERGTDGMTLAEVGEAAGYSRGLPAHYFGSKDGLVDALAEYLVMGYRRRFGEAHELRQGLEAI